MLHILYALCNYARMHIGTVLASSVTVTSYVPHLQVPNDILKLQRRTWQPK